MLSHLISLVIVLRSTGKELNPIHNNLLIRNKTVSGKSLTEEMKMISGISNVLDILMQERNSEKRKREKSGGSERKGKKKERELESIVIQVCLLGFLGEPYLYNVITSLKRENK